MCRREPCDLRSCRESRSSRERGRCGGSDDPHTGTHNTERVSRAYQREHLPQAAPLCQSNLTASTRKNSGRAASASAGSSASEAIGPWPQMALACHWPCVLAFTSRTALPCSCQFPEREPMAVWWGGATTPVADTLASLSNNDLPQLGASLRGSPRPGSRKPCSGPSTRIRSNQSISQSVSQSVSR